MPVDADVDAVEDVDVDVVVVVAAGGAVLEASAVGMTSGAAPPNENVAPPTEPNAGFRENGTALAAVGMLPNTIPPEGAASGSEDGRLGDFVPNATALPKPVAPLPLLGDVAAGADAAAAGPEMCFLSIIFSALISSSNRQNVASFQSSARSKRS